MTEAGQAGSRGIQSAQGYGGAGTLGAARAAQVGGPDSHCGQVPQDAGTQRTADRAPGGSLPLVSIVIPTYNRARWLRECVESALAQDYERLEVLVVDDGSTDETSEIIKGFTDPRLRYTKKEHTGAPSTRNYGIRISRGDFILWLGSDDILTPGTARKQVEVFQEVQDVDVVYGDTWRIGEDGRSLGHGISPPELYGVDLVPYFAGRCAIQDAGTMVRRDCYSRFGPYAEDFLRTQDYEFWTRILDGCKFKHAGMTVCKIRAHNLPCLSGYMRQKDRSYEARIFDRMMRSYPLKRLFPKLFNGDPLLGMSRALVASASIFLRWEAAQRADELFSRALETSTRLDPGCLAALAPDVNLFLWHSVASGLPFWRRQAMQAARLWPNSPWLWRRILIGLVPRRMRSRLRRLKPAPGSKNG